MVRRLALVVATLGAPLVIGNACASLGGTAEGARLGRIESSVHFRDGTFRNTVRTR